MGSRDTKQTKKQSNKKKEGGGGGLERVVRDSVYSLFYTNSQPQKKKHGKKKRHKQTIQ